MLAVWPALCPARPAAGDAASSSAAHGPAFLFVENVGQYPAGVRFVTIGPGPALCLAADGLWIWDRPEASAAGPGAWLRLQFDGADPHARLEPFDRLPARVSYFTGGDPARWRVDVPAWGGVRYAGLYPGVDLELSGATGRWAARWVTRAGAGPDAVGQWGKGMVAAHGLAYSTFLGGFNWDYGDGIVVDAAGRAYVVGTTASPDFPGAAGAVAAGAAQPEDVFVVQLDADGSTPLYITVFGGTRGDFGHSLAVDAAGAAYVIGGTNSFDFPTTPGAFDTSFGGFTDAFVTKIAPGGAALEYSTLLGGLDDEWGWAIAVDEAGSAYVTGDTESSDFPRAGRPVRLNGYEAFVTRFNAAGSGLIYSRLLGGAEREIGFGIAVDAAGAAYVTGVTSSMDFPATPGAYDPAFNGGLGDAFVAKYDAAGAVLYATYLGGEAGDMGYAVAIDASGAAYIAGRTQSAQFPVTPGAFGAGYNGGDGDAFVTRLTAGGATLSYSTFLGGASADHAYGIAVDAGNTAVVTGRTASIDFPVTPLAFDTGYNGGTYDVFVARVDAAGTRLRYSTFLGGAAADEGYAVALDSAGAAYVTGSTGSADYPITPGAFDPTYGGSYQDAYVTKLALPDALEVYLPFVAANAPAVGAGLARAGVPDTWYRVHSYAR